MDIERTKEKLKLLDELMEQTRYLTLWAAEGFTGPEQQKMFLYDRLVRAEQFLFEANIVLSRLCEEIPSNLKSRVSDKPVWLPAMLKWLQEKFKMEDQDRKKQDLVRKQERVAANAERREALAVERFVFLKLNFAGEALTRIGSRMELFDDEPYKTIVHACASALPKESLSPRQFRFHVTAQCECTIDWKPLTDCTSLATFSRDEAPRLLVLYLTGVSEPDDKEALVQLRKIVLERFPTFPPRKFLPFRVIPRPLALGMQLRNELDLETDNAAMSLGAAFFRARGGRHKGAG